MLAGMTECEMVGMSGSCGIECPVYQRGGCEFADEIEPDALTEIAEEIEQESNLLAEIADEIERERALLAEMADEIEQERARVMARLQARIDAVGIGSARGKTEKGPIDWTRTGF